MNKLETRRNILNPLWLETVDFNEGMKVIDGFDFKKELSRYQLIKNPYYLMKHKGLSYYEALDLLEFDEQTDKLDDTEKKIKEEKKKEKASKPKSKGITENELELLKSVIITNFTGKTFVNMDVYNLTKEHFTSSRATPSRLKRLYENGFLERVGTTTPITYKIK